MVVFSSTARKRKLIEVSAVARSQNKICIVSIITSADQGETRKSNFIKSYVEMRAAVVDSH